MSSPTTTPLADLHIHFGGTIPSADYLEFLRDRNVDWRHYESRYQAAYGEIPPIRDILERHRSGDPGAAEEFHRLFVLGDQDAGNFARFQAKFNLLLSGLQALDFFKLVETSRLLSSRYATSSIRSPLHSGGKAPGMPSRE